MLSPSRLALVFVASLTGGLLWSFGSIYIAGSADAAEPSDVIVVMGAAVWNGRPSPVFRSRLDHAAALYKEGFASKVITTGGRASPAGASDSAVARDYLVRQGVAALDIFIDETSASSVENLRNAHRLMEEQGLVRAIIVSDPYHMRRSLAIAANEGIVAVGSPSRPEFIGRRPLLDFFYALRETILYPAYLITTLA